MSFAPLRELAARALMRSELNHFLERIGKALAVGTAEARRLALDVIRDDLSGATEADRDAEAGH
ncbi:hypothetical protein [Bradyrhizobium manausense]|uniref:Uncharacterized protein n=1 Tax=Bradyrhizobium manausense TaxID=989370 RepID=A0A0R3DWP0_9BRAD|nr:hypothetical protein [Bradyrhizobium manausense]KRQ14251.1 hypothetical protein AOQ71_13310 [Bradyrhizobium manausense]